jgi:hypothetical protein
MGIVVNRQLNVHGGSTSALFNIEICSAKKPKNQKRLLYRMKRYRSLLVCDQALLTREKLENDQSSNAEPLSGKPYGLPVGEGSGYAATDP